MVAGEVVHVDASLIRADVSWDSLALGHAASVGEVNDDAGVSTARASRDDGAGDGGPADKPKAVKKKKYSHTDGDARMGTSRRDHRLESSYKQLTAVDGTRGIVVDAYVVSADIHEGGTLMAQLARVEDLINQPARQVTADKGYAYSSNYRALEERGTAAVIPPQRTRKAKMPLRWFKYDARHDLVRCPAGKTLRPGSRVGRDGGFYRARRRDCAGCRFAPLCPPKSMKSRSVIIKDGHGALLRARRRHALALPLDLAARNRHRGLVEGTHGEAKARHGLRRAMRRGLWNVQIQAWLTAAVINLKRLAKDFLQQTSRRTRHYPAIKGIHGRCTHPYTEYGKLDGLPEAPFEPAKNKNTAFFNRPGVPVITATIMS